MASKPKDPPDLEEKAKLKVEQLQQKELFDKEVENQKKLQGMQTNAEKKKIKQEFNDQKKLQRIQDDAEKKKIKLDKDSQKLLLNEKSKVEKSNSTAIAMANREIVKSIAETLPMGFNKAAVSMANMIGKVGGLAKNGLNTSGMIETGVAVLDFGLQLTNAAYTAAENLRLQKMNEAELERQFNSTKGSFADFGQEMDRMKHFLGPANESIVEASLAYSKLVQNTGEAAKKTMRTWVEAAMPENLGENANELLQRTLQIAKNAKTPGSYQSATGEIQDLMKGNIGSQLLRMGIHSKDVMAKYRELGGTENLAEVKANGQPLNGQILAQAIMEMTHKQDIDTSKSTDPIQTLQQQIAKATMETAAGIMQWVYPAIKGLLEIWNKSASVDIERKNTIKNLQTQADTERASGNLDNADLIETKIKLLKDYYNKDDELVANDAWGSSIDEGQELQDRVNHALAKYDSMIDNAAVDIAPGVPANTNVDVKVSSPVTVNVQTTDPDTTATVQPGDTSTHVAHRQSGGK